MNVKIGQVPLTLGRGRSFVHGEPAFGRDRGHPPANGRPAGNALSSSCSDNQPGRNVSTRRRQRKHSRPRTQPGRRRATPGRSPLLAPSARTGRCPGPRAQGRRRGRHRAAGRGPLLCGGAGAGPRGREATPRRHRDAGRGPLLCGGAGRAPPPGRPPTLAARRPPPARPSARRRGYSHTHSSTTYA